MGLCLTKALTSTHGKMMSHYFYDDNQIRYELIGNQTSGPYNWLFLPGGPGADSCYFHSLNHILELPGNVWLIDFPGNGGNILNIDSDYDFNNWFNIFIPMVKKFKNPIIVGHSFGGMFPLLFPELEQYLAGFVILNSMPALWLSEAVEYAKNFDLPDISQQVQEFTKHPNQTTFKTLLDVCIPYYFPKKTLEKGKAFLADVPFQYKPSVWWLRKAAEMNFSAKWIPQHVPTLIIGGTYDCMCPFSIFQKDLRFQRANIKLHNIEDAGHIGWVENPQAVKNAFSRFITTLGSKH